MLSLNDFRLVFPEVLRGDFAFYPILILLVTMVVQLAVGLVWGFRYYVMGQKNQDIESDISNLARIPMMIQVLCFISVVLSASARVYPVLNPGQAGWEMGIGFVVVTLAAVAIAGPVIFLTLDYVLFKVGRMLSFLYSLTHGRNFELGSPVVQVVRKHSANPGPRARDIHPEEHGNYMDYLVDKFRRVVAVNADQVTIMTRKRKLMQIRTDDPLLRKARLFERIRYRSKFPPKAQNV